MMPHETLMRRAINLAMRGRGRVEPNPMVGCLLVKHGRIIAEGFHAHFGGPHAEAAALLTCREDPDCATAIVTLEPCCHLNKKTPPCVPALLRAGIRELVVGTLDPSPAVSGGGIAQLRAAGVRVHVGMLESPCRQLVAPWLASVLHRRPYVTLKWAQSADGLVAGQHGRRIQISGDVAQRAVHELRSQCDAILVGINTVLLDDPLLTVRSAASSPRPLLRVVLDSHLRTPLASALARSAAESPVLIYCLPEAADSQGAAALRAAGIRVEPVPASHGKLDLAAVLHHLSANCTHLLVECGPTLAASFLARNLADRAWVITSPRPINEPLSPRAPNMPWPATAKVRLGDDTLGEHLNPCSPLFFASEPSADLPASSKEY